MFYFILGMVLGYVCLRLFGYGYDYDKVKKDAVALWNKFTKNKEL